MSVVIALLGWLAATAAGGSADDLARAIEDSYAAYFGRAAIEKGIVTAAPAAEGVRVTWDLQKAASALGISSSEVEIDPFSYLLTPGDNGVWTLQSSAFPRIQYDLVTPEGHARGAFSAEGYKLEGLWDPNAEPFLTAKLALARFEGEIADPNGSGRIGIVESDLSGVAMARTGASGVDFTLAQTVGKFEERVAPANAEPGEPAAMTIIGSGASGGFAVSGLKATEIAALWRYFVAHAGDEHPASGAAALIAAALPLWSRVGATANLDDLGALSPFGSARMQTFGETLSLSGLADEASVNLAFDLDGVTFNSPAAPPWAARATPAALHLGVGLVDSGVGEAVRIALADPKFGAGDLSPEARAAARQALEKGRPRLTFDGGRLKTPLIDLAFAGELNLEPGATSGHFRLTADSLDKVTAILADLAERSPDMEQALLTLTLFKGLAKTGADGRLAWDVAIEGDKVTVNGSPLPTTP
ncbi:MAG: hypothetical protein ACLPN5_10395 [Roseiarcus sp.]